MSELPLFSWRGWLWGSGVWVCSYSTGGTIPMAEWRRWWLYQPQTHMAIFLGRLGLWWPRSAGR